MAKTKQLKMAYDVQDLAFKALKSWEDEHKDALGKLIVGPKGSSELAALVGAFAQSQERVRICRNKPLPGVMKPEPKRKATAAPAPITVLEPISADDAPATGESVSS